MKLIKFFDVKLFLLFGLCSISVNGVASIPKEDMPNIVIILSDDLGYGDVGCYGATKINTPNIDRIACEGILFTDAHSPSAVCSPSRYGLLTGEYPFRNKMFAKEVLWYSDPLGIDEDQTTIATLARSKGYATCAIGKWHVGLGSPPYTDFNGEVKPGPLEIGFDECFIEPGNLAWNIYIDNHHVVGADPSDPFYWKDHPKYPGKKRLWGGKKARIAKKPDCTAVFTEKAINFIENHTQQPFLLYFAPNNVHVRIEPGPGFIGKSKCGLYGDYAQELDWMVGEVLSAIDRNGLADNTIVLFSSDNGGAYWPPANAEALKEGHRINGHLLGQKSDVWEGGHRVPFIVRWPGKVKQGAQSSQLVSLVDIMATIADLFGTMLPKGQGQDSYSFLHSLTGSTPKTDVRQSLVYQGWKEGLLAIRQDSWVLIPAQGSDGHTSLGYDGVITPFAELGFSNNDYTPEGILKPGAPPGQLYNLSLDPSQTTNVFKEYPKKVTELMKLLEKIKQGQPSHKEP